MSSYSPGTREATLIHGREKQGPLAKGGPIPARQIQRRPDLSTASIKGHPTA
jgi:hypothetical protein